MNTAAPRLSPAEEARLDHLAQRRAKAKLGWYLHAAVYVVVNLGLIALSVANAVLCTAAPVVMVMMAIERIGPGLTAQTGMVGPLSTIALGVLVLGEPFNGWIVAGTALVLAGVLWVSRPDR